MSLRFCGYLFVQILLSAIKFECAFQPFCNSIVHILSNILNADVY